MGCTSSKENTNLSSTPTTTINNNKHHQQQIVNDQFRKWLKANRPQADEYVLNDIISSTEQLNDVDDYRTIITKSFDLLSERHDIKSTNKLSKLLHKELPLVSTKKISHTIDILNRTADKIHSGEIQFNNDQQRTSISNNGNIKSSESKHGQVSSGEPGIALKEALEKARILFYKGKQAAIFANTNGGYDVRIIDENDTTSDHDGNLLRSIIVTEVKMRPKPVISNQSQSKQVPPPATTKIPNENEIGEELRRSIDAAFKGLEAIYQTSSDPIKSNSLNQQESISNLTQNDIQPKLVAAVDDMKDILLDTIESDNGKTVLPVQNDTITKSDNVTTNENMERIVKEIKEHRETLTEEQSLCNAVHLTSSLPNEGTIASSFQQSKVELTNEKDSNHVEDFDKDQSRSTNRIHVDLSSPSPIKSPSHNVTYTEIIRSESHDGEQSRHFLSESYDETPVNDDGKTTTLKVVTKSEFSNRPLLGEKIMEQSVQVITVKVRNETKKTTNSSHLSDIDPFCEKQST